MARGEALRKANERVRRLIERRSVAREWLVSQPIPESDDPVMEALRRACADVKNTLYRAETAAYDCARSATTIAERLGKGHCVGVHSTPGDVLRFRLTELETALAWRERLVDIVIQRDLKEV